MRLGAIGLGRMGRLVAERAAAEHDVVGYDLDPERVAIAAENGVKAADSVPDLLDRLGDRRHVWLMVPAGEAVDATIDDLTPHLDAADVVIDGGNSHFRDSARRAKACPAAYLDCGTSGGPTAMDAGVSLTIGGPRDAYERLEPVFDAVATGPEGHERVGPAGAGHYVKAIHNGIEYALMAAYGEGFELLARGRYDLDLEAVARTWNAGAVIRSWLLGLCVEAFDREGNDLSDVTPYVAGGSTGSWTVQEAIEQEVPVPLLYTALAERFASREDRFAHRLANWLRYGFGRHEVHRDEHRNA
ncbi:6-phosphogluconate dehydrogenase (decarboxylating) [Halobacteriales archaeon SW_7_68_16]|nr:MAG: 6-phosphogluconate dehydrogenase (decarboxylating) [Halobacteriales archaeon SW_7_68_16]